eukprot:365246-Chlamydomonas_euryale.AAC.4
MGLRAGRTRLIHQANHVAGAADDTSMPGPWCWGAGSFGGVPTGWRTYCRTFPLDDVRGPAHRVTPHSLPHPPFGVDCALERLSARTGPLQKGHGALFGAPCPFGGSMPFLGLHSLFAWSPKKGSMQKGRGDGLCGVPELGPLPATALAPTLTLCSWLATVSLPHSYWVWHARAGATCPCHADALPAVHTRVKRPYALPKQ